MSARGLHSQGGKPGKKKTLTSSCSCNCSVMVLSNDIHGQLTSLIRQLASLPSKALGPNRLYMFCIRYLQNKLGDKYKKPHSETSPLVFPNASSAEMGFPFFYEHG